MNTITAVIIAQNEERNIGRCLDSLAQVADEVVVVDSGSTDSTPAICLSHGARLVSQPWLGYAEQKNFANTLATCQWVLSMDADEALSPTLRQSLLRLKQGSMPTGTAYAFARLNNYCGSWIHHGGWYPDTKVRLWAAGTARWDGEVHEELLLPQGTAIATLEGDLLHYTYATFQDLAARQLRYATLWAQKAQARHTRCNALAPRLKPAWTFVRNYVLRGGFRDGAAGYTLSRMAAYYTFMKYTILRQANQQSSCPKEQ